MNLNSHQIKQATLPNGLFDLRRLQLPDQRATNLNTIRSLTQTAYQGNQVTLCRVLGHFMMFVSTQDERHGVQLQMNGYWEMAVTETLAKLIKPGMCVVDVGANYGYFSLLMAALVGPTGHVTAIEANPSMCEFLNKSIKVNGLKKQLSVINQAISDQADDSALFVSSAEKPMNASLADDKAPHALKHKFPVKTTVKADTFDHICNELKSVDLIKIDIEGAENKFWFGSRQIRTENPELMMVLEFNPFRYANADDFIADIFAQGYGVWQITTTGWFSLSQHDMQTLPTHHHSMLLVTRRDMESQLS